MEVFRAFLYSAGIFAGLALIAVLVAAIMKLMYSLVHRNEKKNDNKSTPPPVDTATPGKVEQP
jgi:hypothetical protein